MGDTMFIDEVTVELMAGDGGNGCMAFRREKYIEMGGPYGGNGGRGSNIIFKVDEGLNTLLDLRYRRVIKGKKGENGLGKGMQGANASDVVVMVPQGSVITDMESGIVMADLVDKNDSFIAAYGGRGGRGNIALATRNNPAPSYCENGEPGEIKKVKVELKLLADVGLVGMPSVGKSTFISKISKANSYVSAVKLQLVRAPENDEQTITLPITPTGEEQTYRLSGTDLSATYFSVFNSTGTAIFSQDLLTGAKSGFNTIDCDVSFRPSTSTLTFTVPAGNYTIKVKYKKNAPVPKIYSWTAGWCV